MSVTEPSIDIINASFEYDPDTGVITWKDRPWVRPCVNARVRGTPAGAKTDNYNRIAVVIDGKTRYLFGHRIAWMLYYGEWPDGEIDHKDGDGNNNRIANLRRADSQKNKFNRATKLGATPLKGVHLDKRRGVYRSSIMVDRKPIYLGTFEDPILAARAYDRAANHYFGEYARTNEMLGLL